MLVRPSISPSVCHTFKLISSALDQSEGSILSTTTKSQTRHTRWLCASSELLPACSGGRDGDEGRCRVWITRWAVALGAAGVLLAAGGGCRAQGPAGGLARGKGGPCQGFPNSSGTAAFNQPGEERVQVQPKKEGTTQRSHANLDTLLTESYWMPRRSTWSENGPYNLRWVNEIFNWCKESHKKSIRASINAPGRFEFASRGC